MVILLADGGDVVHGVLGSCEAVEAGDGPGGEVRRHQAAAGVDLVVEVAAGANAQLDLAVLRTGGTITIYANDGGARVDLDARRNMALRPLPVRPALHRRLGPDHCRCRRREQAIADGAFWVGQEAGLPLHRYPLEETAAAHSAVESGTVGKVLTTIGTSCTAARFTTFPIEPSREVTRVITRERHGRDQRDMARPSMA